MALHIVKMCVGAGSVEQLESWIAGGDGADVGILTRSMPRRRDEVLAGGSLYWVVGRTIQARQRILDIDHAQGATIKSCRFRLDPKVVRTVPRERKPFQGWRYLEEDDAPKDMSQEDVEMPPEMRRELARLGLL